MVKVDKCEKWMCVKFNENDEPQFQFTGAWDIRDLGRTRSTLLRAYKHYIRNIRLKEAKQ